MHRVNKSEQKALKNDKKILSSRVWEFVHIIIGHSITYECPIVL